VIGFGETDARCSATGCRAAPAFRVNWRNPRIHSVYRVKVWLACDEHRDTLADYLSTRGFPVLVTAIDEPIERIPESA